MSKLPFLFLFFPYYQFSKYGLIHAKSWKFYENCLKTNGAMTRRSAYGQTDQELKLLQKVSDYYLNKIGSKAGGDNNPSFSQNPLTAE